MPTPHEHKKRAFALLGQYGGSILKQWLFIPFISALIGTLIFGRIINWLIVQPDSYKVYFVGAFNEASLTDTDPNKVQDPTNQIWNALSNPTVSLGSLDGVPVVLLKRNDFGDERTAERISLELAAANDTLMVIGHVYSTQTRAALPAYLKKSSPPIPVILTTETNPDLLPLFDDSSDRFRPVYRLSPTDDLQAHVAACFARDQKAKAIWVVEAGPNRVYTSYLAKEFIERVQDGAQQDSNASKVLLWSKSLDQPAADIIEKLKIDFIFYAGDWQNALVLARQSSSGGKPAPRMVLSDSAMDKRLPRIGGKDVEGVYLTFPVPVQRFKEDQYAVFGKDSRDVLSRVLERTQAEFNSLAGRGFRRTFNWLLGLKRVTDARGAILNFMRKSAGTEVFVLSDKTNVQFGQDGSANNRTFNLWQIKDRDFRPAPPLNCPDRPGS